MAPQSQPRYVELPNGSYLEWPEGVTADQFKAKALKVMGQGTPSTPVRPDNSVDRMFPEGGTVSAYHPRTGFEGIEDQLTSLKNRLSSHLDRGVGQGAGDYIPFVNMPGGILEVLRGITKGAQGKPWQATKDIVGGGMQALSGPAEFVAPEVNAELPTTQKAGRILEELEQVAGKIPINVNPPGRVAMEMFANSEAGSYLPPVVRRFLSRATNPEKGPLTYSEARKFYSNATALSADESSRMKAPIRRLLGQFTQSLGDSLWEAAQSVGKGKDYNKAMRMYHRAAQVRDYTQRVAPKLAKAAAAGALAGAGYKAYETFK